MFARRRTLLLAALAAQVAVVQEVRADRGKATVTGIVRDANTGDPVSGALVVATSTALQGEQTVTTDSHGLYRLPNLPPGVYNLQFFAQSYNESRKTGVPLSSDQRIRLDAGLESATGSGDVRVVEVSAPTVDIGSTKVGQTIDQEFATRVPIVTPTGRGGSTRSFEALAEMTPGAANDTYGTSVGGTTSPENNYTVNGMNVGDASFGLLGSPLSAEFVKEVNVSAGGYMPEYGRSTGGAISAITKSGSNEFHGGAWANFTPGALEGQREIPQTAGTAILREPKLSWIGDAGADIGGPLIKDRLWFYAGFLAARESYNIRRSLVRRLVDIDAPDGFILDEDTPARDPLLERLAGTGQSRKNGTTRIQAMARLDFRASKNHQISLTGIAMPTRFKSAGLGNGTYDTLGGGSNEIAGDVIVNWNASTDSKSWLFDTMVGYHHQNSYDFAADGTRSTDRRGLSDVRLVQWRRNAPRHSITEFENLPTAARRFCQNVDRPAPTDADPMATETLVPCPIFNYGTGGPGFLGTTLGHRLRASHVVTFFGELAGHHEVKFGADAEYIALDNDRHYTGTSIIRETGAGNVFFDFRKYGIHESPDNQIAFNSLNWITQSVVAGAFIQDSWAIMDRVTVNAGLRYDTQVVFDGNGTPIIALPHQVAPRVGLIWDPTNKGKSKLYASYGRYYQSVPLRIADRGGSGEPQSRSSYAAQTPDNPGGCNLSDPANPTGDCNPLVGSRTSRIDRAPFGTGSRLPIDPKSKAQSSDEIMLGADYEVFEGARLSLVYQRRWLNRTLEDMSRDEGSSYFLGNPGFGLAKDFPKGTRNYDAIIVQLQKRFGRGWMIAANYTASWLRGNVSGLFNTDTNQLDPFANADFDLISLLDNRTGYLRADRRHSIKVFTAGEVPIDDMHAVLLGGSFRASSGAPSNYLGTNPAYGDGQSFILPRAAGKRLPWVFQVDTNFGYRYKFNEDVSLAFTVNIYNALNAQAATRVDENYTFSEVLPVPNGTREDLSGLLDTGGEPAVKNLNFRRPTAYQTPRQVQFGVRLTF